MANPVTHILMPMLIAETYRRYFAKKRFSKWYVFLAGLFGGAPDFDLFIPLFTNGWTDISIHRTFTHTLLTPIALALVAGLIFLLHRKKILRHEGWAVSWILLVTASIGLASHTLLDGIDGFTQWFFPLNITISLPNLMKQEFIPPIVDGIMLFIWLLYDEELLKDIMRVFGIGRTKGKK